MNNTTMCNTSDHHSSSSFDNDNDISSSTTAACVALATSNTSLQEQQPDDIDTPPRRSSWRRFFRRRRSSKEDIEPLLLESDSTILIADEDYSDYEDVPEAQVIHKPVLQYQSGSDCSIKEEEEEEETEEETEETDDTHNEETLLETQQQQPQQQQHQQDEETENDAKDASSEEGKQDDNNDCEATCVTSETSCCCEETTRAGDDDDYLHAPQHQSHHSNDEENGPNASLDTSIDNESNNHKNSKDTDDDSEHPAEEGHWRLDNMGWTDAHIAQLCHTILGDENPCIMTSLSLRHNRFSAEGCRALAPCLQRQVRLQELHLDACDIGDDGVAALAEVVMQNVPRVSLASCNLTQAACGSLAAAFFVVNHENKTNHDAQPQQTQLGLQHLDLSHNPDISDLGVLALADVIVAMQHVALRHVNLGVLGCEGLAEALQTRRRRKQSKPDNDNSMTSLQTLDLSHNRGMGDAGIAILAPELMQVPNVILQDCNVGDDACLALCAAVGGGMMQETTTNNHCTTPTYGLETLDLRHNDNIGHAGVMALYQMAILCPSLKQVRLDQGVLTASTPMGEFGPMFT